MLMYLWVMFWLYRTSVLVWLGLTSCMRMVMPTPPPDDCLPHMARKLPEIVNRVLKVYVWTRGH